MIDWFGEVKKKQIVLEEIFRNGSDVTFVLDGNIVILDLSKSVSTYPQKLVVNDAQLTRHINEKTLLVESVNVPGTKRKLYISIPKTESK